METKPREDLIAPCGMNCGICGAYLSHTLNLPKKRGYSKCIGCLPRAKKCAYLKGRCAKLRKKEIRFCFECQNFPCERLKRLDKRYRKNYNMSMIENLLEIKKNGVKEFLKKQKEKYKCPKCGGTICVHNEECYSCGYKDSQLLKK